MSVQIENKGFPYFTPGDTLKVYLRVVEGDSERIQMFEGVVIRRRGKGISETFTVRKVSFGVGVERTLPLHSPRISKIEIARKGRARRAKLYYLRNLSGKAARLTEENKPETPAAGTNSAAKAPSAPKGAAADKAPRAEAAPAA